MVLPNFLIIGAAKSGTTALYKTLQKHPQVYMSPIKEPNFFIFDGKPLNCRGGPGDQKKYINTIRSLNDYVALFADASNYPARGEASVGCLSMSEIAAPKIYHLIPSVKLIAILRHPADRAYSHYLNLVREGRETLPFEQALAAEESRIKMNCTWGWRYKANGYYFRNLLPYYQLFPREQIRVYLYEDWKDQPQRFLQDVLNYLEVDASNIPQIEVAHVSRIPRSRFLHNFLVGQSFLKGWLQLFIPSTFRKQISHKLMHLNMRKPPALDPEIRSYLTQEYREDILKLQDLIGRDLSHWLVG